jgi:hypothetical protein
MSGDPAVRDLQTILVKYGYMTEQQVRTGSGLLGPKTRDAVSRILADKGKVVTKATVTTAGTGVGTKSGTSSTNPRKSGTPVSAELDPKNKLAAVHPVLADYVRLMSAALVKRGIHIRITDGLRTFAEQDKLYAQGRKTPGKVVTDARGGYSNHNYGLAVDVVPLVNGKVEWNVSDDIWNAIGEEGRRAGLEWGGDWKKLVDRPHFQLRVGIGVEQCLSIFKKGGLSAVWAEANRRLSRS